MKRIIIFYSFVFYILCSCQSNQNIDFLIIENGTSNYAIYVEDPNILPLADTLNKYLSLRYDIELKVVSKNLNSPFIALNSKDKNLLPTDPGCYSLDLEGLNLIINADNLEYLEYAIYDLLEKTAGITFLSPDFTHFQNEENWNYSMPKSYEYCSSFGTRTVHSQLFYDNPSFAAKHKVSTETFPHYAPRTGVHTFHRFVPRADYYESNPKYFALRNGKRLSKQLCLTNEDVLKIVTDSVRSYFEMYPEAKVISVSQDDNQQYCSCDYCSEIDELEGSPSGTMIHFVNKVAASFPDKTISTLAYQYTRKAPKNVKPSENVLITLCSIECDRSGPIAQKCKDFEKDLEEWNAIGAQLRIWDYTTQFTNFLAPFPNLRTLEGNVRIFRENNAKWVFEQHSRNPSELFELRSYLLARLLWNPDLNTKEIIEEFCDKYYGNASVEVQSYIQKIHDGIENDSAFFLFLYGDPSQAFNSYLNEDSLNQYLQIWDSAIQKVVDDPVLLRRVEFASMSTIFAYLERCRKNDHGFQIVSEVSGVKQKNPEFESKLNLFKKITTDNSIRLVNEMGFTVDEYLESIETTVAKALKDNIAIGQTVETLSKPKKYAKEDPLVLSDGAFGGANFYANWLGYEGNDMEVVLDLGSPKDTKYASISFLKVVNHIVFFPSEVSFLGSLDNENFKLLGTHKNKIPLQEGGKINDVQDFEVSFPKQNIRYLKVIAKSLKTAPDWHHGAGMPCWIFADEIIIN